MAKRVGSEAAFTIGSFNPNERELGCTDREVPHLCGAKWQN